ncbi:PREDICTED: uncharacterized protein LOC106816352 [Priapulus caudatus]|uniref:Uncharacterized protein LOC106816352 n=1 Tax=Priapulus caudatus TaxID=37621 RepID=A0ABM1EW45_PRICU|nr:PREDICTED: uncharacterized protein LOC106816352 [Priapulus caudatus]
METLRAMGSIGEIDTQRGLVKIVDRLPFHLQTRWRGQAVNAYEATGHYPDIVSLVDFVVRAAREANDPVFGYVSEARNNGRKEVEVRQGSSFAVVGVGTDSGRYSSRDNQSNRFTNVTCPMCHAGHTLFGCSRFKAKNPDERLKFSRDNRLCDNCLKPGHFASRCLLQRHYQLAVPFKSPSPDLANNLFVARRRLDLLGKKLSKNSDLYDRYRNGMEDLLVKGFAEKVQDEGINTSSGKTWYIPHHAVINPNKEKLRIVFDCAAQLNGKSLNSEVYQGPDFTNKLVGVLSRFRQSEVALMADVEAMYHQSVDDSERAIHLVNQLSALLSRGGFRLTKWMCNNRIVIESIPQEERAKTVKDLNLDEQVLPTERALGVTWNAESDKLGYRIKMKEKPLTRRGILSVVSSIFDPLGLASPVVLPAKNFQDLCRRQAGWDEPITENEQRRWEAWVKGINNLEQFSVDRCIKPKGFGQVISCQLHHFCDASESGYGAVSYVRQVTHEGKVHCCILMAKARLSPKSMMTIPRLELLAAVEAVKLSKILQRELEIKIDSTTFWTDSMLVLQYICNESRRFKTFVANRVALIRESTDPSQWRHVDTEQNPADDASRGLTAAEIIASRRWTRGPDFLWQNEMTWETTVDLAVDLNESDSELKKAQTFAVTVGTVEHGLDRLMSQYSSWEQLRRAVAWFLRLRKRLLRKGKGDDAIDNERGNLSVAEIKDAELSLVRYTQSIAYRHEINMLRNGKELQKSSRLYQLEPHLNADGTLRTGGRLGDAPIPEVQKHQHIIPCDSVIAKLLIQHSHELSGHSGREYTLALLRQQFWLTKARITVTRILAECRHCRRRKASPALQRMADLPMDRVTPYEPAFTYVGVDYFGPFMVKRGRSEVKRYGCLFTCLIIRAIHIEVSFSLDTDSFINALQRFISRRGKPKRIRSDNGTNFTAGEKELREAIDKWNQDKIDRYLVQKGIEWQFNPAAASHMGGVWERQIRTVRKVLNSTVHEQTVGDEELMTLMCLVESIVNGRPMTTISDDVRDLEPLTANHLLLLRPGVTLPCGVFVERDIYRKKWRQVQYLADLFWKRWVSEYLPTLRRRSKWTEPQENIKVGDIVLVADSSTPRNLWPLARVMQVYPGKDGLVRSATVKTRTAALSRPIHKLCLLESVEDRQGD